MAKFKLSWLRDAAGIGVKLFEAVNHKESGAANQPAGSVDKLADVLNVIGPQVLALLHRDGPAGPQGAYLPSAVSAATDGLITAYVAWQNAMALSAGDGVARIGPGYSRPVAGSVAQGVGSRELDIEDREINDSTARSRQSNS